MREACHCKFEVSSYKYWKFTLNFTCKFEVPNENYNVENRSSLR